MNRLRVKEILKKVNTEQPSWKISQYEIAAQCIPFEMNDNSKAQLLAKWNNGKVLHKLTTEVLANLRRELGCSYGELIGTPYNNMPYDHGDQLELLILWIKYERETGNILDAFVKISKEYKTNIDFIILPTPEKLMP